ncbi:MAG TPA: ATP-binding protein [Thermodesulfovibrionales bacterium]|nr:ATP-binding protein [Thermodesulfovibrionales bacterium]
MGQALLKRLRTLIISRAFFVTLLIGSFFLFDIGYQRFPYPRSILYLIIPLYLLSILYAFLLSKVKNLVLFAYIQLSIDVVSEIILIFLTGGIESWFSSIMLLTVMASAIILDKKAGYIIATLCSILYGLMMDLQFYRAIPLTFDVTLKEKDFLYNIFTHISALYLTAYLTGYLSSRLEKTTKSLEEKDSDLKDLSLFNRELIEGLPSGVLRTDLRGTIVLFNKAAEQITGRGRTEAVGRPISHIFPFLAPPFGTERMEGVIKHDESDRIIGLTISDTADSDGNKTGHICIFQDITELKNLEAEVKRKATLAAIGELSTNMAHEIRNPLASLKGSIEMLKEGALSRDHGEKLMDIAVSEMDRLNKIISDFLSYSRPMPPEFSWFDIHRILDDTVELMKSATVSTPSITIKKDFNGRCDLYGDPGKLRQVFLNLAMNAVESMPEGGAVTIGTKKSEGSLTIFFEDTGVGIPQENLEDIFYPFFTTKEKGTGLGLSIAYRILEEHGGGIRVDSTGGTGTRFEVLIPMKKSPSREGKDSMEILEGRTHGRI